MRRTESRPIIAIAMWGAVGLSAGVAFWFVCLLALMAVGFSFAAVTGAAFLEVAVLALLAPIILWRSKSRQRDAVVKYRLFPALAGMLIVAVYFASAIIVVGHP